MTSLSKTTLFGFLSLIVLLNNADAQQTSCSTGRNRKQCRTIPPRRAMQEADSMVPCGEPRTLDGTCTNFAQPAMGKAGTPHFSYFDGFSSTTFRDGGRSSPRLISNVVSSQTSGMINDRGMTEFLVFFGQFLDHCFVQTKGTDDMRPIAVPEDDPLFLNTTTLDFRRSERERRIEDPSLEAPANFLSSAVDLAAVYSSDTERLDELRVSKNSCFMKVSEGNNLPRNENGFVNEPNDEEIFYIGGDVRVNENLLLTAYQLIFLREHNRWCKLLEPIIRNGEEAFQEARKINIAQFQKIVFEEFYPAITGRQLPKWRFDAATNPGVSVLFSTAAFRIGHTMIGNGLQLRGPGNKRLRAITPREMFFRPPEEFESIGPEALLRGSIQQRAQEVDTKVMDTIRQVLFSNVPELEDNGIDLIALNLQRGRDHAMPSYNTVRRRFGLSATRSFSQVTRDRVLQGKLLAMYDTPDDMDIWIALHAEDHERRSSMGPTMLRIWREEFRRLRNGDSLYYERPGHFSSVTIENFPELRRLRRRTNLMREIILRNTDISPSDLPRNVFRF